MTEGLESQRRQWALAYSAGSALTGPVLLGFAIDLAFELLPWFTIAGVFVGMAMLMVVLVRMTQPKGPGS